MGSTGSIVGASLKLALIAVVLSAGLAFAAHGGHGFIGFLLMMACVLYVICAIPWLFIQGMGDYAEDDPALLRDKLILLGVLVASGMFLALTITGWNVDDPALLRATVILLGVIVAIRVGSFLTRRPSRGFLTRLLGRTPDPTRDPLLALARDVAVPDNLVYTRTTCPYCEAVLATPLQRNKTCPSCSQRIAYVLAADGLVHVVREGDADTVRAEMEVQWQPVPTRGDEPPPVDSVVEAVRDGIGESGDGSLASVVSRLLEFGGWITVASGSASAHIRIERRHDEPGVARLSAKLVVTARIDADVIDALELAGYPPLGPSTIDGRPDRRREAALIRAAKGGTKCERDWFVPPDGPEDVAADVRAAFTAIIGGRPPDLHVDESWINEPLAQSAP